MTGYGRGLAALALVLAVSALGPACGRATGNGAPMPGDLRSGSARVAGQYLVTLGPGAKVKVISEVFGRYMIKSVQDLGQDVFLIILTEDPGPAAMEELRGRDGRIKAVQPNFLYRTDNPARAQ